jgi:hypothetical protein
LVSLAAEARQALDADRPVGEAVGEVLVVLLGQQRGRHQHGHLLAGVDGDEGGAHRDLGLAEADVAADHAVHRAWGRPCRQDGLDGALLVRRLLELEGGGEGGVVGAGVREGDALAGGAAGVDVQQLGGDVVGLLRGLALDLVPLVAAEAVQRGVLGRGAGVAGDQVQGADRHVELVAAAYSSARNSADLSAAAPTSCTTGLQPQEAADAVLAVEQRPRAPPAAPSCSSVRLRSRRPGSRRRTGHAPGCSARTPSALRPDRRRGRMPRPGSVRSSKLAGALARRPSALRRSDQQAPALH